MSCTPGPEAEEVWHMIYSEVAEMMENERSFQYILKLEEPRITWKQVCNDLKFVAFSRS